MMKYQNPKTVNHVMPCRKIVQHASNLVREASCIVELSDRGVAVPAVFVCSISNLTVWV